MVWEIASVGALLAAPGLDSTQCEFPRTFLEDASFRASAPGR
jgi:hypothetical protein